MADGTLERAARAENAASSAPMRLAGTAPEDARWMGWVAVALVLAACSTRVSHTCTVLSHPPEMMIFGSSGRNLSEKTRFECPGVTRPAPLFISLISVLVASS